MTCGWMVFLRLLLNVHSGNGELTMIRSAAIVGFLCFLKVGSSSDELLHRKCF